VAYHLQLPTFWKIHDVFHASLLTPYKETEQHGPNFLEPPPEILDREPKWEVEKVLREVFWLLEEEAVPRALEGILTSSRFLG